MIPGIFYEKNKSDSNNFNISNLIETNLKESEEIIYVIDNIDIKVDNKSLSLIGEKSLYLTNLGRALVYDAGGIFTEKSVTISEYLLKLTLNEINVILKPDSRDKIQFKYDLSIDKFIDLYPKFNNSKFEIKNIKDYISIDNKFSSCNINIFQDGIQIKGSKIIDFIAFKYIELYEQKGNILILKGYFLSKSQKKILREIILFIHNEVTLKTYLSLMQHNNLIFSKTPCSYISFTGEINGTYYYKEDAMISVQNGIILIINYNTIQPLAAFKADTMQYLFDKDKLVFMNTDLIILLELHEKFSFELNKNNLVKKGSTLNIGFTTNRDPFICKIENTVLILKQSANKILSVIKINEIANIEIKEVSKYDTIFSKISLKFSDKNIEFYINESYVPLFIKTIYKNSKITQFRNSNVQRLFASWSRQVNDLLNYYYFGSLFLVKNELEKISEKVHEDMTEDEKVKTANILYYEIQNQKKQFELISVYFPKLLEKQEKELMTNVGNSVNNMSFKLLQKQLLSLSNQITRALNEIEISLAQIPYAIYPDINTRKVMTSSRYTQSGINALTGVVSTAVTGIFDLQSIGESVFVFLNAYKTNKALEEIERKKLDIYVNQALDSFNHLVNSMMPYYINEVNEFLYDTLKIASTNYLNVLNSQKVKENLFERICDLYTFKQLPISDNLIETKSNLIEEIHSATNISDLSLSNTFLIEGGNF